MSLKAMLWGLIGACGAAIAADPRVGLPMRLGEWEPHRFKGETRYEQRDLNNTLVIHASSDGSASGLFREQRIDLSQTPVLYWRWRIDRLPDTGDEQSRGGDDYAARVYVVKEGGLFPWRTRALNYVWSRNQPVGTAWPNAYAANARMIALRSGEEGLGVWQVERRDVRSDFRQHFGEEIDTIDVVALMTDTDDSASHAEAWYGDIWFAAE